MPSSAHHGPDHATGGRFAFLISHLLDAVARVQIYLGGTLTGTRRGINLIQGANITLTETDNAGAERVDVTIAAASGLLLGSAVPLVESGTGAAGTATTASHQDHVHPADTTAGTVTSVALTAPPEFSVSGSPITGAGTLAITKANESANQVWAGPTSGGAAAPTFRALVAADIPAGTTGHTIQDEGTPLTARANLNFTGPGVRASDDPGNAATKVQISRWEVITNADPLFPEIYFNAAGDALYTEVPI